MRIVFHKTSDERHAEMSSALKGLREKMEAGEYEDPTVTGATTQTGELLDRTASPPVHTAVEAEKLRRLNEELLKTPEGFNVHRKLRRPLARRIEALEQGGIDFGQAEALAFGTLLTDGVHIRLTGQDTERGTFSHRHLVLHDENTGLEYTPMQHLQDASAPFELYNSPLSEIACLGFEYGYSAASPESLNLWDMGSSDGLGPLTPTNSVLQTTTGTTPSATNRTVDPQVVASFPTSVLIETSRTFPSFQQAVIVIQPVAGTKMGDYHLTAGSPANDAGAGSRNFPPLVRAPGSDIDGNTRSAVRPDIGADER